MNTDVFINEFLTTSGAECSHNNAVEGGMIRWIWELLDTDRASAARQLRREQEAELFTQVREREAKELQRRSKDDADFLEFVVITEVTRRAYEELSRDIDNAITATRQAYSRAVVEEERTREALEDIQRAAIVLPDGRRVYLSRDGRLYGDDCREIADDTSINAANQIQSGMPDAPTFETYVTTFTRYEEANSRVLQLSELLTRLEELKALQESRSAIPEEIQRRRESLDSILADMPPDALAEFNQLKAGRGEAPGLRIGPSANFQQFALAADGFLREGAPVAEPDSAPNPAPAYKEIPNF